MAAALAAPSLAIAWVMPGQLPWLVGGLLTLGLVALAARHLTMAWSLWVCVTALSLEMALNDLIGPSAFQVTIAAVKGAEIGLVGLSILRFGPTFDRFNPAWAFVAMSLAGPAVGMHPELTINDMARSAIGSITPFLVFFCHKPPGWSAMVLRAIGYTPLLAIGLGTFFDLTGVRPLFVDSGGMRLAALGHPAFLAGVCLPAIYTVLLRWLRTASPRAACLLAANVVILILTGARAPMAYAVLVIGLSVMFAPDAAVPRAHRLGLCIAGAAMLPVLLLAGESFSSLRLFTVIANEASDLSGRQLLWPVFQDAADQAPWFGWGLGSGNFIIPHHGAIAQLLRTRAAHNEYLRMQVEGGQLGRAVLILLFVLWGATRTQRLPPLERFVTRLILLAFAGHAATDNVLISSPACVLFTFLAAVFDQPERRLREHADVA